MVAAGSTFSLEEISSTPIEEEEEEGKKKKKMKEKKRKKKKKKREKREKLLSGEKGKEERISRAQYWGESSFSS